MNLSGILAPVLTPFDENLDVDVPRFVAHCRTLLTEGCTALAIFGTTSEANSLRSPTRACEYFYTTSHRSRRSRFRSP
ncbi:MAG: dihydrodipicolinate synthase family protein [Myxococcales bacterium]|nr:dihydrodipicolinate synthase family protein [Myxococcales bacterium]